jgi:hypothetical protein
MYDTARGVEDCFGDYMSARRCSRDGASSGIQSTANDESSYFGSTFTARANRSAAARALQPRVDPYGAASPVIMAVIRSDTTSWRLMWQVNVP